MSVVCIKSSNIQGAMGTGAITLARIVQFFKDYQNAIRKGKLKFNSGFVLSLRVNNLTVNAKVRASMQNKSYSVSVTIGRSGGINQATCEYPRGNWICSHLSAVAIYANKNGLSKTDLSNSWIVRPKEAAKQERRTVSDLFPLSRPDYGATSRNVNEMEKTFLYQELNTSASPLSTEVDCSL